MRSALPLLALLAACERTAADDHRFVRKEIDNRVVTVTIVPHATVQDLRAAAAASNATIERGREVMAWSAVYPQSRRCEVHVVDPAVSYQPEWIGHELAHCAYGRWHD